MSDDVWYACVFFAEEVPARVSKDVKFKKNNTSGKTWDILFLCETKKKASGNVCHHCLTFQL